MNQSFEMGTRENEATFRNKNVNTTVSW
jgi:hypothetical protein